MEAKQPTQNPSLTEDEIQKLVALYLDDERTYKSEEGSLTSFNVYPLLEAQLAKARPFYEQAGYKTGFDDGQNYSFTANQTVQEIKKKAEQTGRDKVITHLMGYCESWLETADGETQMEIIKLKQFLSELSEDKGGDRG